MKANIRRMVYISVTYNSEFSNKITKIGKKPSPKHRTDL